MVEEQTIIRRLKAHEASTRFDACDELLLSTQISTDQATALLDLLQDSDSRVAGWAHKALVKHGIPIREGAPSSASEPVAKQTCLFPPVRALIAQRR